MKGSPSNPIYTPPSPPFPPSTVCSVWPNFLSPLSFSTFGRALPLIKGGWVQTMVEGQ